MRALAGGALFLPVRTWFVRLAARWLLPAGVRAVLLALRRRGYDAYLVGGCVRDLLLGRRPADWDVATSATPDQILEVFSREAVRWAGLRFGTVLVRSGGWVVEVTSFRCEGSYRDRRHPDQIRFGADIQEDLARRDFTVNALALSLDGRLVDPWGGLRDLQQRTVRAVGDPAQRFDDDALRMLRAVRLAAQLEFCVHPSVLFAIQRKRRLMRYASVERIREELTRLLLAPAAAEGLELLRRTGLLNVVLPELVSSTRTASSVPSGGTLWSHALHVVAALPAEPVLRWAALLHAAEAGPCGPCGRDEGLAAASILERLRFDRASASAVASILRHWGELERPLGGDPALRRFVDRVGRETADRLAVWLQAHHRAAGRRPDDPGWRRARRLAWLLRHGGVWGIRDLAVDGHDVMAATGLVSGPQVGDILRRLLEEVWEDPSANRPSRLLARARELARSLTDHQAAEPACPLPRRDGEQGA